MKSRFLVCVVTLLALFAASCGSDSDVTESADVAAEPTAAPTEVPEEPADEAEDEAMDDDEAMAEDDAMDDDEAMAEDGAMEDEEAMEDNEAMADDEAVSVPERIVSLNPTATEMLFAIGAGDQVVAVDQFSYFPAEAPVTDLSGFDPNIEAIAGFEPDLVVTDVPLEALTDLGIENMVISAATNLDDIYAQIEQLGARTGNVGEAAELVLQMQTDIDAALASIPDREIALTYYHELDNTLYSVTSGTFVGYVYSLFGLENIADPADPDGESFGYPQLNEEYVLTADPDLIFLADTLCCEQSAATVAERPGWDQLQAVQNGHVVELNDDIVSRWGPRIVEFIEAVGAAVNELEVEPTS